MKNKLHIEELFPIDRWGNKKQIKYLFQEHRMKNKLHIEELFPIDRWGNKKQIKYLFQLVNYFN